MKAAISALLLAGVAADGADPIGQVIAMCEDLSAKVTAEGEAQQKAYEEYFEWCDDTSKEKQNEITTTTEQKGKLEALIGELSSEVEVCTTKIADLAEAISKNDKDLKAATKIRKEEASVFAKNEAELEDAVGAMSKAISVLEKGGSASLAQVANGATMTNLVQALNVVIDAAGLSVSDKSKLVALVQSHQQATQESDDEDDEAGAPAAANYEKKSGSIVDILSDMKDKAETQLSDLRKAEMTSKQNFQQLEQSLKMQLANDNFQMDDQKKKKAAAEEGKATAEGELEVTTKDLKTTTEALATTQKDCMQVAIDHEDATRARAEELKVIATAIKIIKEATSFAQTPSFLQTKIQTVIQNANAKVGKLLRKLAKEHHSSALAQLASRINSMARSGALARSADPFVKSVA